MEPIYKAKVHADNDYPVKMREQASTQSNVLAKVPQGTIVDVLGIIGSDEGDWGFIMYNDQIGYMMNQFLLPIDETNAGANGATVTANKETLEMWANSLEKLAKNIREIIEK